MEQFQNELRKRGFRQVFSGFFQDVDGRSRSLFGLQDQRFRPRDFVYAFVGPHQPDPDDFTEEMDASVESFLKREEKGGRRHLFDALYSLSDVFGFERAWGLVLVLRKKK